MSASSDADGAPAEGSVRSVDRALSVLEVLAQRGEAGISELARELDCHRSTASRLVAVLERRDLVEQVAERGGYRLAFGLVRLAGAVASRLDITMESRRSCQRLAALTGEMVNIALLDRGAAVNVTEAFGDSAVTATSWAGRRTPLHCSSSGKVLLACSPPAVLDAALAAPLERYTDRTITEPAALREELQAVVTQGFASAREELEVGLTALAAPVRDDQGALVAALSVSGPVYRLSEETFAGVLPALLDEAAALSRRLGFIS